ncbi:MAG: hypothetical protein M1482_08615 [Chloroflexi bacterium]|nr:hypothetical protein [Chloroflexota bacterium]
MLYNISQAAGGGRVTAHGSGEDVMQGELANDIVRIDVNRSIPSRIGYRSRWE